MKALKDAKGFTLIELLVVVAIIGILAAIAIPQFSEYRKRGFDARMQSDARNGATAEEAYFATNEEYTSGACSTLPGFNGSEDVTCAAAAANDEFTVTTTHTKANFSTCVFTSDASPNLTCS